MDFQENINDDLKKRILNPRMFLSKFKFIDEDSRLTPAYSDPVYLPFYYHLGKYIKPKNVLEIGFNLGLFSGTFLISCKTVENILFFQQKKDDFYSFRMGISNIKLNYRKQYRTYIGDILDEEFNMKKYDLILVNEEFPYDKFRAYLDFFWDNLNVGGFIVIDSVNKSYNVRKTFFDFCKIKNRNTMIFETRYGTGIVER